VFVELIELLRCPRDHAETALIASATRSVDRHIVDGVLGCPTCHAQFPIQDGIARFGTRVPEPVAEAPSTEVAMRLAALLELVDARGFALLFGRWGAHVGALGRISDTPVIMVNPTAPVMGDVAATILVDDRVPLAAGSARAAALDAPISGALADSAIRAVRDGGRVLAPVAVPLPAAVRELARDGRSWVAQKNAAPGAAPRLTTLRRSKR
jgi:uncharacterized protein YbaR (Trm112 family)